MKPEARNFVRASRFVLTCWVGHGYIQGDLSEVSPTGLILSSLPSSIIEWTNVQGFEPFIPLVEHLFRKLIGFQVVGDIANHRLAGRICKGFSRTPARMYKTLSGA